MVHLGTFLLHQSCQDLLTSLLFMPFANTSPCGGDRHASWSVIFLENTMTCHMETLHDRIRMHVLGVLTQHLCWRRPSGSTSSCIVHCSSNAFLLPWTPALGLETAFHVGAFGAHISQDPSVTTWQSFKTSLWQLAFSISCLTLCMCQPASSRLPMNPVLHVQPWGRHTMHHRIQ